MNDNNYCYNHKATNNYNNNSHVAFDNSSKKYIETNAVEIKLIDLQAAKKETIKKKIEEIGDLHADFEELGVQCVEDSLLQLLNHFELQSIQKSISTTSPFMNIDSKACFQNFKKHMELQGITSIAIKHKVAEIDMQIDNDPTNSEELIRKLKVISKLITPLNIRDINRLVLKANEAGNKIKGKDIVLFIGRSGSGKFD